MDEFLLGWFPQSGAYGLGNGHGAALLQAMLTRLLELDEGYFYGLPHLLQAVHYASFAVALGGDPAQAQHHFMRAYALSQGRLLLVPLLEAQYYAVQVQDRALFTERLQHILEAPETLFPEQALLNAVARRVPPCCCGALMNFLSKDRRLRELCNVDMLDAARAAG